MKREGRQRIREGCGLFCVDLSAFCAANTEQDTKKKVRKETEMEGAVTVSKHQVSPFESIFRKF